jgi:hypothetical protein
MADYHSIVAKAVSALDPNTGEARRRLYGRARALVEMRRAYPPLEQSDITAAQISLEEAIGKVETQARREQRAYQEPTFVAAVPDKPANQNDEQIRSSLTRLWAKAFRRAWGRMGAQSVLSEEGPRCDKGRDTWLTELLARASRGGEDDDQDFAPNEVLRLNR